MNIKRILAALLAVTVVGASMPAVSVNFPKISLTANAAETESPLEYEVLEDGTIVITGCNNTVTAVEIPAEIDGKKVTSIGDMAFYGRSDLTSVTIPNSVTSINSYAFRYCENLTSITIPESVTSIDAYAFQYCSSLTSITIPKSVTSIEYGAFDGTPWLENKQKENPLVIVNGILIDGQACSGDFIIPEGVTSIGGGAFYSCYGLSSITIPDSVTSIGGGAFNSCSGLTSINVSENNENYADIDGVLFNKDKTELIVYPTGKSETQYIIPDGVTSISGGAFQSCSGLTSITIPDSVTSIGYYSFAGCPNLTSITILNPDCEIYDESGIGYDDTSTIYGYENSTAQAYAENHGIKFESLGKAPESKVIAGDANCDGTVSIADATAILQHLGNQDKYGLSAEGLKNADVDGNEGVSTNDAIVIQKVDAKLLTVEQLPLKNK